jgi:phenylpropionate dioxygenase-like ring-hydroxylating dioxygenase large terminal subunit
VRPYTRIVVRTLPWGWYADPAVARLEQERIFRRAWQYAGHAGELPRLGSYAVSRAGDVPLLLTRDREDVLRAFVNVCRHRGAVVADEPAERETVQCPYHAWTYGLDGELRAAPRADREPDFPRGELGLVPVRLDSWGPLLFVNPDPDARPLTETLAGLPALVAEAGVDVDALAFHHRGVSGAEANWKVVCENYLECYHCAVAHPGFSAVIDVSPDAYELEQTAESFSTQRGPVREGSTSALATATGADVGRSQFHFLWPNVTINVAPGPPNLSIGPVLPDGPERTSRWLDYFFAPGTDPEWVREFLAWDDQVGREDTALVERVQRGVRAGAIGEGRLLAESERLVAHFQRLTARALGDGAQRPTA